MPTYDIQRVLNTSADISGEVTLAGFSFRGIPGPRAVASRSIEGSRWEEAVWRFERELLELLDAIAIVSGEPFSSYAGAVLSIRTDISTAILDAFFPDERRLNYEERAPTDEEVIQRALDGLRQDEGARFAARHFRESLLTTSGLDSSLHLLRSVEALAGNEMALPKCSRCGKLLACSENHEQDPQPRTVRSELKRILESKDVYEFFYGKRGHRNHLMHGRYEAQEDMQPHVRPLMGSVYGELRKRVGASPAPRGPLAILAHGAREGLPRGVQIFRREILWLSYVKESPRVEELLDRLQRGERSSWDDPKILSGEDEAAAAAEF